MSKIVITGASSGIGASIAKMFYQDDSHHMILLGRSQPRLDEVARSTNADMIICDITNEEKVDKTCAEILTRFQSPPDILVNNAGHFVAKPFVEVTSELFREQIDANLTGSFLVTKGFLSSMVQAGAGHIFFTGSVASIQGYAGASAYCAAKHGLLGLARSIRAETLDTGVRVTTILPGATFTPSWDGTTLPEERFIPPKDVAHCVIDAWKLSSRTVIEEILLRPQKGDI